MPRDKKIIHRATSDIEDSDVEDEEEPPSNTIESCEPLAAKAAAQSRHEIDLNIERKKFLKDIILKRNLALKQQREKDRQQKVNSTNQ